jgi:hypothetical protein
LLLLFHLWKEAPYYHSSEITTQYYENYKLMLLLVAVWVVARSINVNMTLAQTIENHLFGINHSHFVPVRNFYVGGKIR